MFTKVIILFSIFTPTLLIVLLDRENCLKISNSKLLLNNIHTPALALEKLLKHLNNGVKSCIFQNTAAYFHRLNGRSTLIQK